MNSTLLHLTNNTRGLLSDIIPSAIAGLIAGVSAGGVFKFLEWLFKPHLKVYFNCKRTFDKLPAIPLGGGEAVDTLFVHLIVKNTRSNVARRCHVFLLKLERQEKGKFVNLKLPVHLILMWSNEPVPKGFSGLEIPGRSSRRFDLLNVPLSPPTNRFFLFIEPGPRGVPNGFGKGIYRFTIQVQGTNTNKVTKKFIIKFININNIKIEEEERKFRGIFTPKLKLRKT
tara:strand:- start:2305 stop:2985 length:681 start_codon:yes stop_codon:yes gene_type:complete